MLIDIFGWSLLALVGYLFFRVFKTHSKEESSRKFEDCWAKTKSEAQYYPVDKRAEFTWQQKRNSADKYDWKCAKCNVKLLLKPKSRENKEIASFFTKVLYFLSYLPFLNWLCRNKTVKLRVWILFWMSYLPGLGFLYKNRLLEGDHIIQAWINGPNADWNLKPKCRKHNRKRGGKLDKETFVLLRSRNEKVWMPEHLKRKYVNL